MGAENQEPCAHRLSSLSKPTTTLWLPGKGMPDRQTHSLVYLKWQSGGKGSL
jgi:hypothetical protein